MDDLEQAILEHVSSKGYRPVKPRKIAKKLGLDDEQARDLKKAVKRLVKAGKLAYAANHAVTTPKAAATNRIVGVFRRGRLCGRVVAPGGGEEEQDRGRECE